MQMDKRPPNLDKRTPNFSPQERKYLLSIVGKYIYIVESKVSDSVSLQTRQETWERIAAEFNARFHSQNLVNRTTRQLKTLYFNIKRTLKKRIAEEHKEQNNAEEGTTADDKKEFKPDGGTYKLNETGTHILATIANQMPPMSNPFNDVSYFQDMSSTSPTLPEPECVVTTPTVTSMTNHRRITRRKTTYQSLYFKKKYETACFELQARKQMHDLDIQKKREIYELDIEIKKKQLENLNKDI